MFVCLFFCCCFFLGGLIVCDCNTSRHATLHITTQHNTTYCGQSEVCTWSQVTREVVTLVLLLAASFHASCPSSLLQSHSHITDQSVMLRSDVNLSTIILLRTLPWTSYHNMLGTPTKLAQLVEQVAADERGEGKGDRTNKHWNQRDCRISAETTHKCLIAINGACVKPVYNATRHAGT